MNVIYGAAGYNQGNNPGYESSGGSGSPPTHPSGQQPLPPVTDGHGGKGQKFKRSYKACINCRVRKIKCDLGDLSNPRGPPCARCRREGRECVFAESRRGGMVNVLAGREKRARLNSEGPSMAPSVSPPAPQITGASINVGASSRPGTATPSTGGGPNGGDEISHRELHNSADALEILAHAARSFPRINSSKSQSSAHPKEAKDDVKEEPREDEFTEKRTLADTELIKEGFLTEKEARDLVAYFFSYLHPFYPFIPKQLQDVNSLAEVPFLLTAITSIASRYYSAGADTDSVYRKRYQELHEQLWELCQRLFSYTVWAEASTRSIGTVFSFLLFSEWNPRAIHRRGKDYANSGNTGITDGLSGLGATRRSDRLAWMLIGLAIRLSQDLGLMDTSSKVFLATHMSEIVLALRMGRKSVLSHSLNDPLPDTMEEFSVYERAELEILQIMSLAHETLYASRSTTRELLKNGRYLTFLALFSPHLDNWEKKYQSLFRDVTVQRESLLFDYHYARLYIYSLALFSDSGVAPGSMANVASILPSSRYVAMASDAAKEMLATANRVHEMDMLKLAPIRWVVRIVHAAIFLVKSIMLTPTSSLEAHRHTLSIIRTTSRTLIDSSPDDIHLSSRYGMILLKLYNQLAPKVGVAIDETVEQLDEDKDVADTNANVTENSNQQPAPENGSNGANFNYENMFDFSRYSFAQPLPMNDTEAIAINEDNSSASNQQRPSNSSHQIADDDDGQNLLSVLDMDFDFLMEGTEGLGFVEPLMEGIEQHQLRQT
uniref:ARAD1D34760p n=1 Tax=Blastobotrys adeninivorans TaxID=409370 RepID=A0A060THX7_BLAAD